MQDDEPRATNQRDGERMRECALAGRREVRWMNDLLDEWRNGVCGHRHVEAPFRCFDCPSEPQGSETSRCTATAEAAKL